jgi:hypothetical protein
MRPNTFTIHFQKPLIVLVMMALFLSAFGASSTSPALAQGSGAPDGVSGQSTGPDLEAVEISLSAPDQTSALEFYENDDIGMTFTVKNNGEEDSGEFVIYFIIYPAADPTPDISLCESVDRNYYALSPSLAAGGTDYWDITISAGTLDVGDYTAAMFVDSECNVDELDEANNFLDQDFSVIPAPIAPPPNDDIENAIDLTEEEFPYTTNEDTRGATRGASDPSDLDCKPTSDPTTAGLASIWYSYTPDSDQNLVLDTIGSNYDTYIVVWKDGDSLEFVDCNEDISTGSEDPNSLQSRLPVKLLADVKYYFEIAQYVINRNSDGIFAQAAGNLVFSINYGYEISGNVSEPGVTLSYFDGFPKTVISDGNGDYTIVVPSGWSGNVTPSKEGYAFVPTSRDYAAIDENLTAENYNVRRTFLSNAKQDGWVLESGEFTNQGGSLNRGAKTLNLGDDAARRQYRVILSFNTSTIPSNAVIAKAQLKIKRHSVVGGGNPVNIFNGFMVDVKRGNFGKIGLQLTDFNAKANKSFAAGKPKPVGGWYTLNLNKGRAQINKDGNTQIRLRFKLDDNNDSVANILRLYSGNAGTANRPQLIIEYGIP